MSYIKMGALLALAAALVVMGLAIRKWDRDRLQNAYDRGAVAERAVWTQELGVSNVAQAKANQAAARASSQATDAARAGTAKDKAVNAADTQSKVEEVVDARQVQPAPVCAPDGRPGPMPARVLQPIDAARAAAYRAQLGGKAGGGGGKARASTR